jgi:predicted DsbA family dithiol-disulfide isomerase
MAPVPALLFSDFACPFSYATEAALQRVEGGGPERAERRAFELFPPPARLPLAAPEVEAALPLAAALGVELRRPPRAVRTGKAHELARFGEQKGVGPALRLALFAAYFAGGRDIGRIDVLAEVAAAVGLDASEARVVLDVDTFRGHVAFDQAEARRLGIAGTPALLLGSGDGARLVAGALTPDEIRVLLG